MGSHVHKMQDEITVCMTPSITKAVEMYAELSRKVKENAVITDLMNYTKSIKAQSLHMTAFQDEEGQLSHVIKAIGEVVVQRRQFPQKPTSGLIEEE